MGVPPPAATSQQEIIRTGPAAREVGRGPIAPATQHLADTRHTLPTPVIVEGHGGQPEVDARKQADASRAHTALLENLGLLGDHDDTFLRAADMLDRVDLVPTHIPSLPAIDCVAISSINRPNLKRPYIYDTLVELFAAFPEGVEVNIMVGNADVDYLSPVRLLGGGVLARHLDRIHIWPADEAVARHLVDGFAASTSSYASTRERRASWNYARAMRNYRGDRGLLLFEDDIDFAPRAGDLFQRALVARSAPVVSLFNRLCADLPRRPEDLGRQPPLPGEVEIWLPEMRDFPFWCTQAMYYAPHVARTLGDFIHLNMHLAGYDALVSRYLQRKQLALGYAYPSLVQHVGRDSAVKTPWFPESECTAEGMRVRPPPSP